MVTDTRHGPCRGSCTRCPFCGASSSFPGLLSVGLPSPSCHSVTCHFSLLSWACRWSSPFLLLTHSTEPAVIFKTTHAGLFSLCLKPESLGGEGGPGLFIRVTAQGPSQ